jgi:hypothetical protein
LRHHACFVACLAAAGLMGCSGGEELIAVQGIVTMRGRPLTEGSVSFRPDASQGNASLHHPTGGIDGEGKYRLWAGRSEGAPPGWYKVVVIANEPEKQQPNMVHPGMPKPIVDRRYWSPETTPLCIEVRRDAPPGSYDLQVEPVR